jgi:signal peptidase I
MLRQSNLTLLSLQTDSVRFVQCRLMEDDLTATASPERIEGQPVIGWKRRVLAAVLSPILPGTGHWLLGDRRGGVIFFALFCVVILCFWPVRLPKSFIGLQLLVVASMSVCVVAACGAVRVSSAASTRGPRWWLLFFIPLALMISFVHSNWLLRVAGFQIFDVPSTGMQPTVLNADRILIDLRQYRDAKPQPHDIVIFRKDGLFFIKRVVAAGGETVEGKDGVLFVNGHQLEEPYVQHVGKPPPELQDFGPTLIPQGELFVVGDNRDVSRDSRLPAFGPVSEQSVAGKALYVLRSTSKRYGTDLR